MRIQEGLLSLTEIETYKVLARILTAHAEKLQSKFFAGNDRRRRAPVNFRFLPCLRIAWNKYARYFDPQNHPGKSNIAADSGFSTLIIMLIHQTIVYPVSRMPLLLRLVLVALKPVVDSHHVIAKGREWLMAPFLVSPWLSAYGFLDRVSRMAC